MVISRRVLILCRIRMLCHIIILYSIIIQVLYSMTLYSDGKHSCSILLIISNRIQMLDALHLNIL